ncbi:hypothetical protein K461DRAFT_311163 [Myriangium duriaei CBS 260.36]|uniref:DUF3752 domain-containing protein n=1 Tax=Myriangium duriaei CBS 260.36 TaxID=1168546 RepID=A0A9P4J535_9PEZI|nr:hypothetical protein K461DRAFT_311163 [Myriangium duriaei CBS 260.36]
MSAAGPELPPHLLAKRKRQQEEAEKDEATTAPGAKRAKSPSSEVASRVIGPAPPPAPLEERPSRPPNDNQESENSDDDDDFGPALPTAHEQTTPRPVDTSLENETTAASIPKTSTTASRRDDWMTMPPTQDDLAARLDPTRPRARGFNAGKSARGPPGQGADNSTWTETPEQKRKRLEDQVMGVKADARTGAGESDARSQAKREEDRERAAKIKANRGQSLYDMHQKQEGVEKDDDPSQRAFDREKDMATGRISGKQRNEMLNKASGFNSKFSGGSFL